MMTIMLMMMMIMMLTIFLMMISFILSKKSIMDREKMTPFECGFDPKSSSRMPFSLRFFLITIMFLIFDVEITLMLPMSPTIYISNLLEWTYTSIIFIIILLIGLYHEWNQGMLNWSK
uniref:NADH dehydrogenase subunit 3 n=1 Tax=Brachytarsina amboinensis TaxID=3018683 RepID=UPI0023AB0AB7|nr:NADH dehydrogenase subunit 3 [Brachytarsina amboinensis]WCL18790.1 NADH dehydrogenase subunit 3 [Brachytarsina amboinensis]WHN64465.1 NADH dehydrogenase subunit 3 [Brachytarsina amboinensis]